jgi:hypothetical protein
MFTYTDFTIGFVQTHVKWVPSHHGVALPRVVDGRDGRQIRKAAANISNK